VKSVLNAESGVATELDAEKGAAALVLGVANLAATRRLWPDELLGKNKTSRHNNDELSLV
jgi:hypothetical protein